MSRWNRSSSSISAEWSWSTESTKVQSIDQVYWFLTHIDRSARLDRFQGRLLWDALYSVTGVLGTFVRYHHYNHIKNYTAFQKTSPFSLLWKLAKYYPISIIFGSSIPEEICNKSMLVYPPHLFTVLIPFLVNIMIHLPEEFSNETFTSLSPPNLALCVAAVPCHANKNLTACQTQSLSKIVKQ